MNKDFYLLFAALFVSLLSFTSCQETSGVDEYADWQPRNDSYLSFIASEAKANRGEEVGKWKIIKSYLLNPDINNNMSGMNDYVYARINKVGTGKSPIYTDSISYYYRGTLINGYLFDKSPAFTLQNSLSTDTLFTNKANDSYGDIFKHVVYFPDLELVTPAEAIVGNLIGGMITSLQDMKEGDYWTIYVPASLAYGGAVSPAIPAYSMLIFDLYLLKAYSE